MFHFRVSVDRIEYHPGFPNGRHKVFFRYQPWFQQSSYISLSDVDVTRLETSTEQMGKGLVLGLRLFNTEPEPEGLQFLYNKEISDLYVLSVEPKKILICSKKQENYANRPEYPWHMIQLEPKKEDSDALSFCEVGMQLILSVGTANTIWTNP